MGIVQPLALWHGVLAFGLGLVLGSCLDAVPVPVPAAVATTAEETAVADEPLVAEQREAAYNAEPNTVLVGPADSE
jgi:hypothetical protein